MVEAVPSKRKLLRDFANNPQSGRVGSVFAEGPRRAELGPMNIIEELRNMERRFGFNSETFFDDYRNGRYGSETFKIPERDMVTWVGLSYIGVTTGVMR